VPRLNGELRDVRYRKYVARIGTTVGDQCRGITRGTRYFSPELKEACDEIVSMQRSIACLMISTLELCGSKARGCACFLNKLMNRRNSKCLTVVEVFSIQVSIETPPGSIAYPSCFRDHYHAFEKLDSANPEVRCRDQLKMQIESCSNRSVLHIEGGGGMMNVLRIYTSILVVISSISNPGPFEIPGDRSCSQGD
jgi:hypothetical protein